MKQRLRRFFLGDTARPDPDYPLAHVPLTERRNLLSISVVLLGFTFFYATMYAGADMGSAFRYWPDLYLVIVCGSAILGLYVGALSAISARTGLTTVLLARYTFGDRGSKWADLVLGGTQLGWFGVTVALMAKPFTQWLNDAGLVQATWNEQWMMVSMCFVWAAAHTFTAYFGYSGMEKLSLIAVPLIIILGMIMALKSFAHAEAVAGSIHAILPKHSVSFAAAMTIVVGTFASGGTQAPNWARFASGPRTAFWAALIAFFFGNGLMLWFGAVGGNVYGEPDFAAVLKLQGMLGAGLILLVLNVWTTNDNAAYAVGVAGTDFFRFDRKRPFILFCGAFGFVMAISGAYDMVRVWMQVMGLFIPPLGGVILGDFLLVWRMRLPRLECVRFVSFRLSAIFAYALGVLAAYVSQRCSFFIPPLNGILVGGLAHLALYRIFRAFGGREHEIAKDAEFV
jgi:cytosine permease